MELALRNSKLISPMIPARARFLVKPSFGKEAGIIGETDKLRVPPAPYFGPSYTLCCL